MDAQYFVLQGPPRDATTPALKMAAKRYTEGSSARIPGGLTLFFAHCIGAHKEQWEPIIDRLFDLQKNKNDHQKIREAWSFDYQNHGDSAILNRDALKDRPEGVSSYEWASAIALFVKSPRMRGHRIVALGHSAGAAAALMTTKYLRQPYPFVALLLVEPTLVTRELFNAHLDDRMAQMNFSVSATLTRKNTWQSREQAFHYFRKRIPWGMWDERVVRLYAKYGLEDLPNGKGVALKCDRKQESASFPDVEPHFEGAVKLKQLCRVLPVHLIWGTRNDLVPDYIQDSLSDPKEGRNVASITKIEDAGHLVVQEKPDELALAIEKILDGIDITTTVGMAKL